MRIHNPRAKKRNVTHEKNQDGASTRPGTTTFSSRRGEGGWKSPTKLQTQLYVWAKQLKVATKLVEVEMNDDLSLWLMHVKMTN